ncbi:MAG: MarP family serine protease [Candidatus Nanopelagicales bacterium]|nr:MarP family serine protease [Candidatus Nanopelagicales bacterium]MCF8538881.1 MarP family serine protease [Candidatus Nanopelagicales bacterium]MCF8551089.1 MarP family serine protease [Candidatus Nanopelagicales bacterium]
MNTIDWILLGALAVFAWAGWRQGFVAGVLSFSGFLVGGIAALVWAPALVDRFVADGALTFVVLAVVVLASAIVGQVLFSILGRKLRDHITWRPVRFVDNSAGAALNVLAFALVGWVIASVLAFIPNTSITQQVAQSKVLTTMDALVPDQARSVFSRVSDLVGESGVPRIVIGLGQSLGSDVPAPDSAVPSDVVPVVETFVARLTGDATECDQVVSGSGFYVNDHALITNAHVVAGVESVQVRLTGVEQSLRGEVVYFDPEKDIAVVVTDSIDSRPGLFAKKQARQGSAAVVAGFPGGGSLTATPARVRSVIDARGENIYGDIGVQREVYAFRSSVLPGNSGGPLVDNLGRILGLVFGSSADAEIGYALTNAELADALERATAWTPAQGSVDTGTCALRQ